MLNGHQCALPDIYSTRLSPTSLLANRTSPGPNLHPECRTRRMYIEYVVSQCSSYSERVPHRTRLQACSKMDRRVDLGLILILREA